MLEHALQRKRQQSAINARDTGDGCASFAMPIARGELIAGKYKVLDLIGTGGIGFVVSARHVRLDELVALKFLRPEFASDAHAVRRFTIEARASFKIDSDHVVRVLDVDALADGTPFMVMELLEGKDLGRVLAERRSLPVEQSVEYALQVCEALAAAHGCYVVHRDIKPENLFVSRCGAEPERLKVLDFGISKLVLGDPTVPLVHAAAVDGGDAQPVPGALGPLGSPPYMSPEQLRAAEEVDARSDIWSLGCVLYELITGIGPFDRASVNATCTAVLEETPAPLRLMCPGVAPGLEAVVLRCLQKEPEQRFQDVAELACALSPFAPLPARAAAERCRALLAGGTNPVLHAVVSTAPSAPEQSDASVPSVPSGLDQDPSEAREFARMLRAGRGQRVAVALLCLLLCAGAYAALSTARSTPPRAQAAMSAGRTAAPERVSRAARVAAQRVEPEPAVGF